MECTRDGVEASGSSCCSVLSGNGLRGTIPEEIGELTSLSHLYGHKLEHRRVRSRRRKHEEGRRGATLVEVSLQSLTIIVNSEICR